MNNKRISPFSSREEWQEHVNQAQTELENMTHDEIIESKRTGLIGARLCDIDDVWREPFLAGYARRSAIQAMQQQNADSAAKHWVDRLTDSVVYAVQEIMQGVGKWEFHTGGETQKDGMWWFTANLADYIEAMAKRSHNETSRDLGFELADDIRNNARDCWESCNGLNVWRHEDRWRLEQFNFWYDADGTSRAMVALAWAIWELELKAEFEKYKGTLPALTTATHRAWRDTLLTDAKHLRYQEDRDLITDASGRILAQRNIALRKPGQLELILNSQNIMGPLRTGAGRRMIRYFIERVFEQWRRGEPDFRAINIHGGFSALARDIGETSKKSDKILKEAIEEGAQWEIKIADREGRVLWGWREYKQGRTKRLEIIVATELTPLAVHEAHGADRILIPVIPEPELVGRNNEHGAQLALVDVMTGEMVQRQLDILKYGGVRITEAEWEDMAHRVGLPVEVMEKAREAWTGPVLERVSDDIWHLADNETYGEYRAYLNDGAELRNRRSLAGKKGIRSAKRKKGR
jgi:hypothetical protein